MTQPIKAITSVLKASTDIITNIPARPTRLAEILAIMSVSTFKIAVTLYLLLLSVSFPLISKRDIFSINELTMILNNMRQAQPV